MSSQHLKPFTFVGRNGRARTIDAEFFGELRVHASLDDPSLVNVSSPLGLRIGTFDDWDTARSAARHLIESFPSATWAAGEDKDVFANEDEARRAFRIVQESGR